MRSELSFALALLAAGGASGCAAARYADSAADALGAPERELDFWQALESRPLATNHDALHALLLLADGADDRAGFEERLAAARARGWVEADDELDANAAARVGVASVAVCEMLGIHGGVTLALFGLSERYCTRELVFLGVLPDRTERQALRGLELIDLAGRVDDWRARHGPAADPSRGGAP